NYQHIPEDIEAEHMAKAIEIIKGITGTRPLGWYTGRTSPNTRRLVAAEGGFLYDADDYSDDLPFWSRVEDKDHLIVPYTLDTNDMRFLTPQGFSTGEQFYTYLMDSFYTLYDEASTAPKMMSIGLHCRIIGKPGRFQALQKFLEYVATHDDVWLATRLDIAKHWRTNHPATGDA
ncbi:MAG: chitin deacetylase, partial [Sphingomonadales bacterium]|nr:chitin deacetylase [Sphingomonadales bacterium]